MLQLVTRNLFKHPIRSFLTVASLIVALFLLCTLRTVVTSLSAGIDAAGANRLWVQSAVSLFVDMPVSYQPKIEAVAGVEKVGKWQWFGAYYQERGNFFAQFAVDGVELLEMYPEIDIVEGSAEDFLAGRTSCLIGRGLSDDYGWQVGDTVPLIGGIFAKPSEEAWEFQVAGIYEALKPSLDQRTLFFNWDYFAQTQREITGDEPNSGTFVLTLEPGGDATAVMSTIDTMFENGPQRVQTTTEAEFNRQFVSMIGNLPRLLGAIGGGVFVAILLACINTMLMAGREQVHDVGILKALGFGSGTVFRVLMSQSMVLCCTGGALGIALALAAAPVLERSLSAIFPSFVLEPATIGLAGVITVAIGLLAGIVPAWTASRRPPVADLRQEI